jgi:hypothetical protein
MISDPFLSVPEVVVTGCGPETVVGLDSFRAGDSFLITGGASPLWFCRFVSR